MRGTLMFALGLATLGCAVQAEEPDASSPRDAFVSRDAYASDAVRYDAWAPFDAGVGCRAARYRLREEITRITSCTRDEECGLQLDPRCGCSVDRVARLDADRTRFDELAAQYRMDCRWYGTLDRSCDLCHDVVPPGVACIEGTCTQTIADPLCFYDGTAMRLGDALVDFYDCGSCQCDERGAGCTALLCVDD